MADSKAQSMSPKILLLGGGYTLKRVAESLPAKDFLITTTSADKFEHYKAEGFNAAVLNIFNATEVENFFKARAGFEVVIDGIPPHWSSRNPDIQELTRALQGVRHVASALAEKPPARIIYLSTTGVYGVRDGSIVDETWEPGPSSVQAQARLQSEAIYSALKIPFCALRISAIYGPGRTPLEAVQAGTYPYVQSGIRWSNRIHVDDLAQIIIACIRFPSDKILPPALNISDGKPMKNSEVIEYICKRYDLPLPQAITLTEAKARGLHTLLNNQRIDNSLMLKTLGINLSYDSILDFLG